MPNSSFALKGLKQNRDKKPTDDQCVRFLRALDDIDKHKVEVETDWEAGFIDSNLDREEFTDAQKEVIGRMIEKYGHQFEW